MFMIFIWEKNMQNNFINLLFFKNKLDSECKMSCATFPADNGQ